MPAPSLMLSHSGSGWGRFLGYPEALQMPRVPSSSHPAIAVGSWGSTVQAAMPAGCILPPHPSQVASRALLWDWGAGAAPWAAWSPDRTAGSVLSLYEGRWEPQHEWHCFCPTNPHPGRAPGLGIPGCIGSHRAWVLQNIGLDHSSAQEQTGGSSVFPENLAMVRQQICSCSSVHSDMPACSKSISSC